MTVNEARVVDLDRVKRRTIGFVYIVSILKVSNAEMISIY